MSKAYEALDSRDVESHSPPGYRGQFDELEIREDPSDIQMNAIPLLSQTGEGVAHSSDDSSQVITTANMALAYGPAGLVQVGQSFDSFQCVVERTSDFGALRQHISDELAESKPDLELVALTIPGLQHERSSRPKLTSGTWSRLHTKLCLIGLVTRRKAIEVRSRNRKIKHILASVFAGVFVCFFMVVGAILKANQARMSRYQSSSIVVTFKDSIAAGEQRTLQCINNVPTFLAATPKHV